MYSISIAFIGSMVTSVESSNLNLDSRLRWALHLNQPTRTKVAPESVNIDVPGALLGGSVSILMFSSKNINASSTIEFFKSSSSSCNCRRPCGRKPMELTLSDHNKKHTRAQCLHIFHQGNFDRNVFKEQTM